jgi:hypothetical protein
LFALIEALVFHANGLTLGPNAVRATGSATRSNRSFEVVGRPPVDLRFFGVARKMTQEMLRSRA